MVEPFPIIDPKTIEETIPMRDSLPMLEFILMSAIPLIY